jgi:hypothetical protein
MSRSPEQCAHEAVKHNNTAVWNSNHLRQVTLQKRQAGARFAWW